VFDVAQAEGADLPKVEHNISGELGEQHDRLIDFPAQSVIVTRAVTGKMRLLNHVHDAAGIPIDALSCGEPIQYS
jgi:hypothetical protein